MTPAELAAVADPPADIDALTERLAALHGAVAATTQERDAAALRLQALMFPPATRRLTPALDPPPYDRRDRMFEETPLDEAAIEQVRTQINGLVDLSEALRRRLRPAQAMLAALERLQATDDLDAATHAANNIVLLAQQTASAARSELAPRYTAAVQLRRNVWLARYQRFGLDNAPELLSWPAAPPSEAVE